MRIRNANIYTEKGRFQPGSIVVEGDKICAVELLDSETYRKQDTEDKRQVIKDKKHAQPMLIQDGIVDAGGCYVLPGMIDMHFHGCLGSDICDGSMEALEAIAGYELSIGVTSMAPATMTLPVQELMDTLDIAAKFRDKQLSTQSVSGAELLGINMEGPFISSEMCGAQKREYIIPCDAMLLEKMQEKAKGLIKVIGIAPEKNAYEAFIARAKEMGIRVSLAHTDADYETARNAFLHGADHVVHLYNGMKTVHHREPGVMGAALDTDETTVELICDGLHVHPGMVRATFKVFGEDRIMLVSDSMRATGMPDGIYLLGGQEVEVKGNKATLMGTNVLAGSVTTLPDCVRMLVREMKIPLEKAVKCATLVPAKYLGADTLYGSITPGKFADMVLWDLDLSQRMVIKKGQIIAN